MKVFIANFGQQNYLWPACLERSTVATINKVQVHPFWEARDRKGYVAYALANMKTARGETPTPSVASPPRASTTATACRCCTGSSTRPASSPSPT